MKWEARLEIPEKPREKTSNAAMAMEMAATSSLTRLQVIIAI